MKVLKLLTLAFAFISLTIFSSCGNREKIEVVINTFEQQAGKLIGTWKLNAGGAINDVVPDSAYDGMTLSVSGDESGGSLTTTLPSTGTSTSVWPATSDWVFCSSTGDTSNPASQYILRQSDGKVIGIPVITENKLELTFKTPDAKRTSKANGIPGTWTFIFTKQ